jgi:hypothetical protein
MAVTSIVRLTDVLAGDAWAQALEITQSGADFTGFALDLEWDGSVAPVVAGTVNALDHGRIDASLSLTSGETTTLGDQVYNGRLKLSYPGFDWQTILRFTLRIAT